MISDLAIPGRVQLKPAVIDMLISPENNPVNEVLLGYYYERKTNDLTEIWGKLFILDQFCYLYLDQDWSLHSAGTIDQMMEIVGNLRTECKAIDREEKLQYLKKHPDERFEFEIV